MIAAISAFTRVHRVVALLRQVTSFVLRAGRHGAVLGILRLHDVVRIAIAVFAHVHRRAAVALRAHPPTRGELALQDLSGVAIALGAMLVRQAALVLRAGGHNARFVGDDEEEACRTSPSS